MKNFLVSALGLMLFCTSCNRSPSLSSENKDTTASSEKVSSATISASPNPIPPGSTPGTTTITWDTQGDEGQVYVSENGAAEKLVASGATGSQSVDWIRPHVPYEFRLYKGSAHKDVLAHVRVTH
jgi:hypothetical protein